MVFVRGPHTVYAVYAESLPFRALGARNPVYAVFVLLLQFTLCRRARARRLGDLCLRTATGATFVRTSRRHPIHTSRTSEPNMSHRQNLATAKYIADFLGLSTVYTALSLRSKQLKRLSDEGRRPVVLPRELPGHFLMALRHKRPTDIDELSQLSGLWVAFFLLQLCGCAQPTAHLRTQAHSLRIRPLAHAHVRSAKLAHEAA